MRILWILIGCTLLGCGGADNVENPASDPIIIKDDSAKTETVSEQVKPLKIVETTQKPFEDWWNIRSKQPSYLTADFIYVKKLKTKPRPVSHQAKLKFMRKDNKSYILIKKYKKDARSKENVLVNSVMVTDTKYIEYTASSKGTKETDLSAPGNEQAKKMLTTLMIYGRTKEDLLKNFHIREVTAPAADKAWKFKLIPKDDTTRKNIPAIQIDMVKATFKAITFFEDTMFGDFNGKKVSGSKQYFQFKFNKDFDYKTVFTSEDLKKLLDS